MKFLKIFFSVFLIFTFIGCNGETTTSTPTFAKLSTPTNIVYDGLLTWDDVDNALSYDVSINGDTISVNDNFYAFDEEGSYTVSIIAKAPEYIDSDASESINLTIDYENNVEFNLSHDDGMISWNEIDDAIEYNLFIDGIKHNTSNNVYSIDGEDAGVISISVQAVYPIGLSNISEPILVEYNLTETEKLDFQYSTYSTQDVIIWEYFEAGKLYVQNIDNEFLNIEDVLMMASNFIQIKSSFLLEQEVGTFSFYIIHDVYKTLVEIVVTDQNKPYIISSTNIYTSADEDVYLQYELFEGEFYSLNGSRDDNVLYQFEDNILRIDKEYISEKLENNTAFVLSYVLNQEGASVIGYLYINEEE